MKVLILSCNIGGGHNAAASAVEEALHRQGHTCLTINALAFLPKPSGELLSRGHNFLYRHTPWLFGAGYRYEEKHQPMLIYEQTSKGAKPLLDCLNDHLPDAVICVHAFAAMMMTELRRSVGLTIPTWFVATDYTCSPGVGALEMDGFFIPHSDLIGEFTACGAAEDKLIVSGIPVRSVFTQPISRTQARQSLGLAAQRVILLACGSMGAGPMRGTARRIHSLLRPNDLLVAVCGSNKRLHQQLEEDFRHDPQQVRVLGFTDRMAQYMHAADLLVTKAGGLTTAEAVAAEVPLLYLDAVPGNENHNLKFMTSRGYCLAVSGDEGLLPVLVGIQSGAIDPATMVRRRRGSFPQHAADTIARTVTDSAQ